MERKLAVIGVGNMAKAIVGGIVSSQLAISDIIVYDKNSNQYNDLPKSTFCCFHYANTIEEAVASADCVLLSVKPQNYTEVLSDIQKIPHHAEKLYISIAAGISVTSVTNALGQARVIRVLPNVPMLIGKGVSLICKNDRIAEDDFSFVCTIFQSSGSILLIDEHDMNPMIGVTSSSPAYVFRFIDAIYQGALAQGISGSDLLNAICDVVIGSAQLLRQSDNTPEELIAKVSSKGGTTEQAMLTLQEYHFQDAIIHAMKACTKRADELGSSESKK